MKQIENTLQDLKCMLIVDGYTEANIVLRTLIKAQEQVKNCDLADVVGQSEQCCSNPKHKTEVNDIFENWVECKSCGKEII